MQISIYLQDWLKKKEKEMKRKTKRARKNKAVETSHSPSERRCSKRRKETAVTWPMEKDSTMPCHLCNDEILAWAPVNDQKHLKLVKSLTSGSQLSLWKQNKRIWSKGLMLDKLVDGNHCIYEIKCEDDYQDANPQWYHLIHFRLKDVRKSRVPFPKKLLWNETEFNKNLVSMTDIVCTVYGTGQLDRGRAVVEGSIQFGLAGPICSFFWQFSSSAELTVSLRDIVAGLSLIRTFGSEWAPRARRYGWLQVRGMHQNGYGTQTKAMD